jgi:hypothetical protein
MSSGNRKSMRYRGYACLIVVLIALLVLVAGCTTPTTSPGAPAPAATAQPAAPQQPANPQQTNSTLASASGGGIDTTVNVHSNDFACLDVQKGLGVDYLYEDQKYNVWVGLPLNGRANVNALFVDTEDKVKMLSVPPKFDDVNKVWVYEGLVPLLQFNDITTPQQKTITIKRQGQFYLCIDDRKEAGGTDVTYQVPVKFTPA